MCTFVEAECIFLSAPTSHWVKIDVVSCVCACYRSCFEKVVSTPPLYAFASETFII